MTDYIRRRTSVSLLYAHLIFTVKYRRKVISRRVLSTITETARDVAARDDISIQEIDGERDHLHMMLILPPAMPVSRAVQVLKIATSRAVRERAFPEVHRRLRGGHFWSPSYFVVSCGGAPLEAIKTYNQNQRNP